MKHWMIIGQFLLAFAVQAQLIVAFAEGFGLLTLSGSPRAKHA